MNGIATDPNTQVSNAVDHANTKHQRQRQLLLSMILENTNCDVRFHEPDLTHENRKFQENNLFSKTMVRQ